MENTSTTTLVKRVKRPVQRHKLYKAKKMWVSALISGATLATMTFTFTNVASADVTTTTANTSTSSQQVTNGNTIAQTTSNQSNSQATSSSASTYNVANASTNNTANLAETKVTATSPLTEKMNVDHSNLDSAVAAASNAGMNVTQNPTTTQTVDYNQASAAVNTIKNDYANQTAKINSQVAQYQHIKANESALQAAPNGDTADLDAKVNEAANIPGLTVVKDDDHVTQVDTSDDTAIANWKSSTGSDYRQQENELQNAIDTQKRNNQEYDQENAKFQQEINSLTTDQHAKGTSFFMNGSDHKNGYMKIDYNYDVTYHYNIAKDQIIVTDVKIKLNREEPTQKGNGFWDTVIFANPNANLPQELGNYFLPNGDLPGTNGDSLWNKYGNNNKDVFAFVSQNNQTEQYTIKYNTNGITPYAVNRNSDGTFTLFKTMDRGNLPNHSGNGDQGWHIWWANGNLRKTITIPQAPQRKATETHYDKAIGTAPGTIQNSVNYTLHDLNVNTTPDKNWVNGQTTVNSKTAINDDIVSSRVNLNYLKPSETEGGLTSLKVTDDYTKFANEVDYAGAQVFENNEDKTSAYSIENTGKQVIATRNNPAEANGGQVSLIVDFKIKPGVKTGTILENSGSGTINNQTVKTPDVDIKTYEQETAKHWMEGKTIVDDKTKINEDMVDTQVSMTLPDQSTLTEPLSYISVEDNYSDFADKTQLMSYNVYENDKDVADQYTITNKDGHLTAVRKNASTAPAGQVVLKATFKVNKDVLNGTNLVNRGSGRINNHTVETNQPKIVTFTQDVSKHWIDGSQVVDTKTAIADDIVTTRINSTLPDPAQLAAPLTYVSIDDDWTDFMNSAQLQSWQVLENDKDVTDQYTVTNENGHITAVRKNAASAPAGQLSLVATFKINDNIKSGTKLTNTGSSRINNHTVSANKPYIITYTQTADKHWVDGRQNVVVDGKKYVDGDDVEGLVTMSLPNPSDLIKPLQNVVVRDDYTKFTQYVTYKSASVLENNKDVTDQYTITNQNGVVTATRKDPANTPAGNVQLKVVWTTKDAIPTGTELVNSGSGTINNKTVNTPDRTIYTFYNSSDKHWIEGNRVVDSLTRINDDMIHAEISTQLPNPEELGHKLQIIQLVDDWSDFKDKAKITSYHVYENDKDATDQYNIILSDGLVTATRKDASTVSGGTAKLVVDWQVNHDVKAGTLLKNTGYSLINKSKVNVPTVNTVTYTPQTDKHWVEGSQNVDDKTYVSGDMVHGDVSMTLPEPDKLAAPLTSVIVTDNYTDFKDKVSYQSAKVYENDKDVTSLYTITDKDGVVTATRKDPASAPTGNVHLKVDWKLNTNLPNGTVLTNKGSGQINNDLVPTPDRNIYVFTQSGEKHWVVDGQVVDSKTVINDDTISANIGMTLPDKNSLAKTLTKVQIQDDYTDFYDSVGQPTVKLYENGADVTSDYTVKIDNGLITATRKDPTETPGGNLVMNVTWTVNHDVKSGTTFKNRGIGTINDNTIKTNKPDIVTYTPETDKHWTNDENQVVDNKVFIAGDTVSSQVSMTLPNPSDLSHKLTKVQLIDNFTDFADKVDLKSYSVTEGGEDVTDQYDIEVTKDHQIIATRKKPGSAPSGMAILHATWTLHKDVPSGTVLTNKGSGQINNDLVPTPDRKIKTYTQDAEKHWENKGGQVVDNKVAVNDDTVTAAVNMTLPKAEEFGGKITQVQLTDDFSKFAKYVDVTGVHVYENGQDVTEKYKISIDKNGKVVATRKNPGEIINAMKNGSSELNPSVTMKTDMNAKQALNVNDLKTQSTGSFNNMLLATKSSAVSVQGTTGLDDHVSTNNGSATNLTTGTVLNSNGAQKTASSVTGQNNQGSVQSYVSADNGQIKSQTDLELPQNGETIKNVALTNDYSQYSQYATPDQVHVYEDGQDASAQYSVKDDGTGHLTATRNSTDNLNGGQVTMTVDFKLKSDIPDGTKLENTGYGTINNSTVKTNTPSVTTFTQKAEKHWFDDNQVVDDKVFIDGSIVKTKVTTTVPDPAELTGGLTKLVITDDYSKFKQYVDLTDVQVLENGKDATDEYKVTKIDGLVTATRKDASTASRGIAQLILSFKIHDDVPSGTKLVNLGYSTINDHTVTTNTPEIETFLPDPTKDVVISVDNQDSLDGKNIDLNQSFDYKLAGATVPANIEKLSEYGFHDDYDQEHDQYNGGYIVLLNNDVTLTDGTVLKKNTDVTKYTTQTIDTDSGKVNIEFDKDFLSKVDTTKSSFGATSYLKMKRIKSGKVQNKYTNTINNQSFTSNTVTTTTEEPKTPETPSIPQMPEVSTPRTPTLTASTPTKSGTPMTVAYTPQVQTPEATPTPQAAQESLPQTGNDDQDILAILGLAALGAVGTIAIGSRKKRFEA